MKLSSYLRLSLFIVYICVPLLIGASQLGGGGCGTNVLPLTSIAVTPLSSTLLNGTTLQLTATGTYSDDSTTNLSSQVTWNSSDTSVASISTTGLLTSVGAGSTTITATLDSVTSNTSTLSVILVFAAGYSTSDLTTDLIPLAYITNSGGSTWDLLAPFTQPDGQPRAVLNEIVCVANDCVAVGLSFNNVPSNYLPLAYSSNDGGNTWTMAPTFPLPVGQSQGSLNSVDCFENICTGVGQSYDVSLGNMLPLSYTSTDNGVSWSLSPALTLPESQIQGLLGDVSCEETTCTTVGYSMISYGTNQLPMAYTSNDNGITWTLSSSFELPSTQTQGLNLAVDCEGSNCITVGVSFTSIADDLPLAYTSNDGGVTWTLSSDFTLPQSTGQLTDIFCENDNCLAVGSSTSMTSLELPLAYTSSDGGSTWTLVAPFPLPSGQDQAELNNVSCADNTCIASGGSDNITNDNPLPLAYFSNDFGSTWTLSPAFELPSGQTQGLFE